MQQNIIVGGLVAGALLCLIIAGALALQGRAEAPTAFLGAATTIIGILIKSPVGAKSEA